MYYNEVNGMKISALGLGGLHFPAEKDDPNHIIRSEGQKIIDAAFEKGINYFDTAYTYQNGDSERFMGEALSKYPRGSYYLATKFYVTASRDINAVFEEQLRRLKTDYFDFYLLHCLDEGTFDAYTDKTMDYIGYMLKQKEGGRIRNIGFSSHASPETLAKFLDYFDGFDMALIQLNYLDWKLLDAKRQYEILKAHNIPVWVMEPMKGGRLSVLDESCSAKLMAAAPERSISSWGFRFLMGLEGVNTVLSGMSDTVQLEDNAKTFYRRDPLNPEEQNILHEVAEEYMEKLGVPCSACRYCCDTCPAGLNIPLLIKLYNEENVSGSTWRVPVPEGTKGASHCINCGACRSHCPQKIDIPSIMQKLAGK